VHVWPRIDTQTDTDAGDHNAFRVVYDARNVMNTILQLVSLVLNITEREI